MFITDSFTSIRCCFLSIHQEKEIQLHHEFFTAPCKNPPAAALTHRLLFIFTKLYIISRQLSRQVGRSEKPMSHTQTTITVRRIYHSDGRVREFTLGPNQSADTQTYVNNHIDTSSSSAAAAQMPSYYYHFPRVAIALMRHGERSDCVEQTPEAAVAQPSVPGDPELTQRGINDVPASAEKMFKDMLVNNDIFSDATHDNAHRIIKKVGGAVRSAIHDNTNDSFDLAAHHNLDVQFVTSPFNRCCQTTFSLRHSPCFELLLSERDIAPNARHRLEHPHEETRPQGLHTYLHNSSPQPVVTSPSSQQKKSSQQQQPSIIKSILNKFNRHQTMATGSNARGGPSPSSRSPAQSSLHSASQSPKPAIMKQALDVDLSLSLSTSANTSPALRLPSAAQLQSHRTAPAAAATAPSPPRAVLSGLPSIGAERIVVDRAIGEIFHPKVIYKGVALPPHPRSSLDERRRDDPLLPPPPDLDLATRLLPGDVSEVSIVDDEQAFTRFPCALTKRTNSAYFPATPFPQWGESHIDAHQRFITVFDAYCCRLLLQESTARCQQQQQLQCNKMRVQPSQRSVEATDSSSRRNSSSALLPLRVLITHGDALMAVLQHVWRRDPVNQYRQGAPFFGNRLSHAYMQNLYQQHEHAHTYPLCSTMNPAATSPIRSIVVYNTAYLAYLLFRPVMVIDKQHIVTDVTMTITPESTSAVAVSEMNPSAATVETNAIGQHQQQNTTLQNPAGSEDTLNIDAKQKQQLTVLELARQQAATLQHHQRHSEKLYGAHHSSHGHEGDDEKYTLILLDSQRHCHHRCHANDPGEGSEEREALSACVTVVNTYYRCPKEPNLVRNATWNHGATACADSPVADSAFYNEILFNRNSKRTNRHAPQVEWMLCGHDGVDWMADVEEDDCNGIGNHNSHGNGPQQQLFDESSTKSQQKKYCGSTDATMTNANGENSNGGLSNEEYYSICLRHANEILAGIKQKKDKISKTPHSSHSNHKSSISLPENNTGIPQPQPRPEKANKETELKSSNNQSKPTVPGDAVKKRIIEDSFDNSDLLSDQLVDENSKSSQRPPTAKGQATAASETQKNPQRKSAVAAAVARFEQQHLENNNNKDVQLNTKKVGVPVPHTRLPSAHEKDKNVSIPAQKIPPIPEGPQRQRNETSEAAEKGRNSNRTTSDTKAVKHSALSRNESDNDSCHKEPKASTESELLLELFGILDEPHEPNQQDEKRESTSATQNPDQSKDESTENNHLTTIAGETALAESNGDDSQKHLYTAPKAILEVSNNLPATKKREMRQKSRKICRYHPTSNKASTSRYGTYRALLMLMRREIAEFKKRAHAREPRGKRNQHVEEISITNSATEEILGLGDTLEKCDHTKHNHNPGPVSARELPASAKNNTARHLKRCYHPRDIHNPHHLHRYRLLTSFNATFYRRSFLPLYLRYCKIFYRQEHQEAQKVLRRERMFNITTATKRLPPQAMENSEQKNATSAVGIQQRLSLEERIREKLARKQELDAESKQISEEIVLLQNELEQSKKA